MISVIIPVIRPEKAQRCVDAITYDALDITRFGCPPEYLVDDIVVEVIAERDVEGIGCPAMVKKLADKANNDLIMFLGDDTLPKPGFIRAALNAMKALPDGWGVVGLNTQDDRPGVGFNDHAHWMAHKKMLEHIPGGDFFSTEYHHCYGDDELKDIAIELGRWTVAEDSRILHDHPVNGTAEYDEGYKKAYDGNVEKDRKAYYRRKIERHGFRVGIGTPLTGTNSDNRFQSSYRRAVYSFLQYGDIPSIREYEPNVPIGHFARDIATNRNDLVQQALEDGMSHLIMSDTDQVLPEDVFVKLITHAARGLDVVVAPVHRRYDPFDLILMRGPNPDEYHHIADEECYSGKLIEVDAGGSGCFIVSLKAILDIDYPWFTLDDKTPLGGNMGEDIAFFWKLRQKGYQIWADTSIEIGHIADIVINREFREIYKILHKRAFEMK